MLFTRENRTTVFTFYPHKKLILLRTNTFISSYQKVKIGRNVSDINVIVEEEKWS